MFVGIQNWKFARDLIRLCDPLISHTDWESHMQLERWIAVCETQLSHHELALMAYNAVIQQFKQGNTVSFVVGDWRSFQCSMYFQRAQINHLLGYFEDALLDLQKALRFINEWIYKMPSAPKNPAVFIAGEPGLNLLRLEITERLKKRVATKRTARNMVELYHWVAWRYSLTLLWQYLCDPTVFDVPIWKKAFKVLRQAAKSSEHFTFLMGQTATMHASSAEMALLISKHVPPDEQQKWLNRAEKLLALAELNAIVAEKNGIQQVQERLFLDITHALYTMHQAIRHLDDESIQDLVAKVEQLCVKAEGAKAFHIAGRCQFILGKLAVYLEKIFFAQGHFMKALEFYQQDGNPFARVMETQRALEALR